MLASGDVFAGYVIDRQLGRGGMGSVYLAQHPRLPRMTALKLLNREMYFDKEVRARFEREADLVAQLDHPGIVTVYDRGVEDEQLWISMQYIDGVDAASVDPGKLPPDRAVQIITETADALDYAHGSGVLHRDVKPGNILLARSTAGRGERVYLTDFGIARLRDDTGHLTQTGTFTATLAYASPEQLTGVALDHRSDQYSLACSLYWLFTGNGPFTATNPAAVIQGHLQSPPPALSTVRPDLPPALDAVLAKAMAKRPEDRFASCAQFAAAAKQALVDPPAVTAQGVSGGGMPPGPGVPHTSGPQQQPYLSGGQPQPFPGTPPQPYPSNPQQPAPTAAPQPFPGGGHGPPNTNAGYPMNTASGPPPPPPPHQGMQAPNYPQQGMQAPNYPQQGFSYAQPPGGSGGKNTGLIVGLCVGLVLLIAVVVGIVVVVGGDDTSGSGADTSASTTTSAGSGATVPATVASMSEEFPGLVPASESGEVGYNNADCWTQASDSAVAPDADEPDFGAWAHQWRCHGGSDNADPFYRIYVYESAADAEAVVRTLSSAEKTTDTNGGKTYTNYKFPDSGGATMITQFSGDPDRGQYLMFTDGVVDDIDEITTWWRSAPLN